MGRFRNFSLWRGRLPHWRADDERYYVTFRHKRPLDDKERRILMAHMLKAQGRRLDYLILCVTEEKSEMVFTVGRDPSGEHYELSDIVEKAKTKAGRQIMKLTGERWPPFYMESFDRIVRDEAELQETWERIFGSVEDPESYETLFVLDAPSEEV